MLDRIRERLTYANVMSTLAVFIALGGSSYAAAKISGSEIKNRSISGSKLKHNTLTGTQIKESKLARVPRARDADRVGGTNRRRPEDPLPRRHLPDRRRLRREDGPTAQLVWQRDPDVRYGRHAGRARAGGCRRTAS